MKQILPLILTLLATNIFAQEPPLPTAPSMLNPPPGYVLVPIGVIATNDLVPKKFIATNSVASVRHWRRTPKFTVVCPQCQGTYTNQVATSILNNGGRSAPNGNIVERQVSFMCPNPDCGYCFTAKCEKFVPAIVCVEE